jgi:tRNA-2-methylthio-N6-dimethylallyladenosine synthase
VGSFHIWTIGCQMNTADSRRLAEELQGFGYEAAAGAEPADLVVLYSCMVRQHAEDKVHTELGMLKRMKRERPDKKVILAGCIGEPDWWRQRYPWVDYFLQPGQDLTVKDRLRDLLELQEYYRQEPEGAIRARGISEGITIHQGCNRACTFCIVPSTRGRERSRTPDSIVAEARELVSAGAREVVLLSQIVERYGRDLQPRVTLAQLLARLDGEVEGLHRIRFLTSYPGDVGRDLIEAVARLPRVCEDINLPLQSGDDEVLARMWRGYTVGFYKDLVARIRDAIPGIGFQTDIIVGFPGETEAQLAHTLDALRDVQFDKVHVAAYSPRPGTPAAAWPDQLPPEETKRRLQRVEEVQREISLAKHQRLLGQEVEVLAEGRVRGAWYGRTRTNRLVHFASPDNPIGRLVRVRVTQAGPWSLQGEPVAEAVAVA